MGAGSSTLPQKLTEEDLQKLCKQLFQSFKDSDGFIDREALIHAAFSGQEKEVHDLFMQFANSDGLMDNQNFTKLCRTAKILNKDNFTQSDAVRVFERARISVNASNGKKASFITYHIFRTLVMPDIASMKQIHLDNLIYRLSRVEARPPLLFVSTPTDEELGATVVDDVDIDEDGDDEKDKKSPTRPSPVTPQEKEAIKRIQSVSRRMIAKQIVKEMKTIKATALQIHEEDFDKSSAGVDVEMRLKRVFQNYCRSGQMDSNKFVKLCRDSNLIDRFFTMIDAELCFLKSKVKASSSPEYESQVYHAKRIGYKVFREVLLRCVTERKKCPIDTVIHCLLNVEDILRATTNAATGRH